MEGNKQIVELFPDEGADVHAQPLFGSTPALHAPSRGGHIQIVRVLLESGANVNNNVSGQGGLLKKVIALQVLQRRRSLLEKQAEDEANLGELESPLLTNGAT